MFALSGNKRTVASGSDSPAGEQVILPRPVRRAVRIVVGLCTGRILLPNSLGRFALAGYGVAVISYGVVAGGHTQGFLQSVTSMGGFAIENVKVSGNHQTSEIDILQTLNLDGTTSLISLNVDAARKTLAALPWIEKAEVRKVYPHTIDVVLEERKPYGIWQHGDALSIIEKNGSVIGPLRDNKFAGLPLFVGRDAETAAADVEDEFAKWPDIAFRIKAFVRIASRRWDVHLENGIVVKLPETHLAAALDRLERFNAQEQVLERDIAAIDLRLDDRIAIQLTPEAQERREAAITERDKAIKKAGERI